jgi:hypothetical protein
MIIKIINKIIQKQKSHNNKTISKFKKKIKRIKMNNKVITQTEDKKIILLIKLGLGVPGTHDSPQLHSFQIS